MSFRDGPLQDLRIPLAWAATVATLAAGVAALFLMIEDHHSNTRSADAPPTPVRNQFDESVGPVSAMFAAPLRWAGDAGDYVRDYFNAVDENRRLKKQVADLMAYKEAAQRLQNINARYEALLQLRTEPAAKMVTARVVADARGLREAGAGACPRVSVSNPTDLAAWLRLLLDAPSRAWLLPHLQRRAQRQAQPADGTAHGAFMS